MQFIQFEIGELSGAARRIVQPDVVAAEPDPAVEPLHIRAGDVENPATGNLDRGVDRTGASEDGMTDKGCGFAGDEFVALLVARLSGEQQSRSVRRQIR